LPFSVRFEPGDNAVHEGAGPVNSIDESLCS
jgi:hypothetical protein